MEWKERYDTPFVVMNRQTGEIADLKGVIEKPIRNYTLRRLNVKLWIQAYAWFQERVLHSNLDVKILNKFMDMADSQNLVLWNQSKVAKELGTSRQKIAEFTKRLKDIGFIAKEAQGVYRINPYVYLSTGANALGKEASRLQWDWFRRFGEPKDETISEYESLIDETFDFDEWDKRRKQIKENDNG